MLNQSHSLPDKPDLGPVPSPPEKASLPFDPLDQRYVATQVIKNLTVEQLSKLELERHNLRLAYVAHNFNPDIRFEKGDATIGTELERIANAIHNIEKVFDDVLKWEPPQQ